MRVEHVPLLKIQRDLHDVPRGLERFREYLNTMLAGTGDIVLPLVAMNPMGREHVAERLDAWLALDAEAAAADAVRRAQAKLSNVAGELKTGLVIADDKLGSWTNRFTTDAASRFESAPLIRRGWITILLWSSEEPNIERLRLDVLAAIYRTLHLRRYGAPETLGAMLQQEGRAARFAGASQPLDEVELRRARELVLPRTTVADYAVCFAALFGDEAAEQLGYDPLGVPAFGGLHVALAEAQREAAPPESVL